MNTLAHKFIEAYSEMKEATGYLLRPRYILSNQIDGGWCDVEKVENTHDMGFRFKDGSFLLDCSTFDCDKFEIFDSEIKIVKRAEIAVYE